MGGLPVTIRTLDPPLHEFLPKHDEEIIELAQVMGVPVEMLRDKVNVLQEFNPMLGHRGCRLGISYPEITEMQAQAIFEAACELRREGKNPFPEIMIPLVGSRQELREQKIIVERVAACDAKILWRQSALFDRHDDRTAARLYGRGRDRRRSRVLFLRHQ